MINHLKETEQVGLCSTCIYNANCIIRSSSKGKILQCEEFDDRIFQEHNPIIVKENQNTYSALKGLCMNCDLADTCALPKPVTGVWHCNEYR